MSHCTGQIQFTTYKSCQNHLQGKYDKDSAHHTSTLKQYNTIYYNVMQ